MGFGGRDYFARAYEKKKEEWEREQVWFSGWQTGYRKGTRDMKRAYGSQVGAQGQKKVEEEDPNEGLPRTMEESQRPYTQVNTTKGPHLGPHKRVRVWGIEYCGKCGVTLNEYK